MVRTEFGKWDYLIKVFLTIDKEDWEQNQTPPGFSENSENSENFDFEKTGVYKALEGR